MNVRGLPVIVGSLAASTPLEIAERAIECAEWRGRNAIFALSMGPDRVVWMDRARDINPREWVATFVRKSNPDWLAEEIECVAEERGIK